MTTACCHPTSPSRTWIIMVMITIYKYLEIFSNRKRIFWPPPPLASGPSKSLASTSKSPCRKPETQREYYHSIFWKWTLLCLQYKRNVADVTLGWVSWNEPDVSWGIPEGDRASLIGELAHCSFLETIGWGFCKWKRWAMMTTKVNIWWSFFRCDSISL